MVLDTSALVAILLDEPDRPVLTRALADAAVRVVSAATLVEAGIVIEARLGDAAGRELDLLLHRAEVTVVPVDAVQAEIGRAAWRRFGKGRHPAGLDYGDCFAYALAVDRDEPLLFKGDDFAATDVRSALGGLELPMARMQPERLDPALRHTNAEEAIFAALRDETPDAWLVLQEVFPWRDRNGRLGRPHFVAIGPAGVLCLSRGSGYAHIPSQGWSVNGHGTDGGVFRGAARAEEEVRSVLLERAPGTAAGALLGWGVLFGPQGRPEGPPFPDEDPYVSHELHRSPESLPAFLDRLVRRGRVGRRIPERDVPADDQRRIALALDPGIDADAPD